MEEVKRANIAIIALELGEIDRMIMIRNKKYFGCVKKFLLALEKFEKNLVFFSEKSVFTANFPGYEKTFFDEIPKMDPFFYKTKFPNFSG